MNPARHASEDAGSGTQEGLDDGNEGPTGRGLTSQERIACSALDACCENLDELRSITLEKRGFSGIIEVFYHSRVDCQQDRETSQDQGFGGGCLSRSQNAQPTEAFLRKLVTTPFARILPTVFPSDNGGKTVGSDARRLSQSA